MYNGNLPPLANTSTLLLFTSCSFLMFSSAQLLPHQHKCYFMAYWSPLVFCWHFLFLFPILPSPVTCYWKLASFSWKSAGNCWQCEVLWRRQPVPSHCMYTPTHAGLELILHLMSDLTGFYTSFFYHITNNLQSLFLLKCTYSIYGNSHAWALWNMFRYCSHLSASRYVVHFTILFPKDWTILLHCSYSFSLHC